MYIRLTLYFDGLFFCVRQAEANGAQLGIQFSEDGTLAESAISTIAIVDQTSGAFRNYNK